LVLGSTPIGFCKSKFFNLKLKLIFGNWSSKIANIPT
jgi:hypothetical protein